MAQQKDAKTGKWMYYGSYVNKAGKRIQYKKRGFDTKKEAIRAEIEYRDRAIHESDYITFEDLYKEYVNYHKKRVKQASIETDKFIFKKLIKDFNGSENYAEKEFLQSHVDEYDKKFSKQYVAKIFYCLKKLFDFAILEGYLEYNPMSKITRDIRKNEQTKEMLFWEPADFEKFINEVDHAMYRCAFMTLYYMGIRRGEMLVLTWNDIDFHGKTITINKTFSTKTNAITTPKTKNSYRTITMPKVLIDEMYQWKNRVEEFIGYDKNGFVFGNDKVIAVETLRRKFNEYIQLTNSKQRPENQIPVIRIHDLRHSHASYLINNMSAGFTDFDIAKRLGDTVATLHNTYAHWFKAADKNIINFMDEEFG